MASRTPRPSSPPGGSLYFEADLALARIDGLAYAFECLGQHDKEDAYRADLAAFVLSRAIQQECKTIEHLLRKIKDQAPAERTK